MKVTILGCGTSFGVPRIGPDWGACNPNNPKNARRRASILVEDGEGDDVKRVLVDTSTDLRAQFLGAGISEVDAVVYSHAHADHTNGIDDLRAVAYAMDRKIDIYGDQPTLDVLNRRFEYIFAEKHGYPPICAAHEIDPSGPVFDAGPDGQGMQVTPFLQDHGSINSVGYRFGDFAYSTDLKGLPEESFAVLEGIKVWVVDALRYEAHGTHAHLDLTLEWIERVKPERAILTHMTWEMDYETVRSQVPDGVEPAYDGMVIEL